MLMSASSEFVALCREQIALLAQGLGASLSVVYLTQELVEAETNETKLIPVVVYPETATEAATTKQLKVGNTLLLPKNPRRLLHSREEFSPAPDEFKAEKAAQPPLKEEKEEYVLNGDQVVLPLVHEGVMMGLLVTGRDDRPWSPEERTEIQRIAQTLAIACILDRQRAWLQQQLHTSQIVQEQQRDLLDNLLHQFRNPLTALRTFGKLLLKRLRPGEPNQEVAVSIVRESDRLQELLVQFDRVIDLTEADLVPLSLTEKGVVVEATVEQYGKVQLLLSGAGDEKIDCYLADILEPLLLSAKAIARERNLELIAEIPPQMPLVKARVKSLTEVLSNIIDNALKYTPSGGAILIQAGQEKAEFQGIAISDTGPGIPPQDLEHLGERHYRGVQAETEIPGTGLGLAIAKQLIEQMQGEIQVFSPAIYSKLISANRQGTTFIIWLPVVKS
jgi:signal transduction histidine kinase